MACPSDPPSPPAPGEPVLVVGGRGFVGSAVVRALLAAGHPVHLLGPAMQADLLADLAGRFGETVAGVEDRGALRAALAQAAPAAVVSCAAFSAGAEGLMRSGERAADQAFAVNVEGFRRLLETAAEAGVRRVAWTSSTVVYGPAEEYGQGRVDEDAPKRPRTVYGLTKHLAEEVAAFAARRHGIPVVGLRLPLVLGPGLWYRGAAAALAELIAAARPGASHRVAFHGEPIDLLHVRDAAAALLRALYHPGPLRSVYNLVGFTARLAEITAALEARAPGFRVEVEPAPPGPLFPLVSDARFRADTGFAPTAGLGEVLDELMQARKETR